MPLYMPNAAYSPTIQPERYRWMVDALCTRSDPELWFSEDTYGVERAKAICRECPVINDCAADILANPSDFGVWAGTSGRQRRMRRQAVNREKRAA